MGKRKREAAEEPAPVSEAKYKKQATAAGTTAPTEPSQPSTTIQIITGSYDRILHGITAAIPQENASTSSEDANAVSFADTFLFAAHASAIRCLALSPPSDSTEPGSQKVILASGSTDERIQLHQLSTTPPLLSANPLTMNISGTTITENPKNRELGSLNHHSSSISALHFPSRSKLLSAAEDNTIAVIRTRDWTALQTIKAPIPKPLGRPSGDTAGPGEVPAGINDFAVHPSMKLMVSVGKGERCMRLWNLVTGKKAGVLNFDKGLLQQVGEGKYSSGEGRKVGWDPEGEEFFVAFERGAVLYGMDSKPRARTVPSPPSKIHQCRYLPSSTASSNILAISTEDGRIVFFSTKTPSSPSEPTDSSHKTTPIHQCTQIAQLGGRAAGVSGRIKDFEILQLPKASDASPSDLLIATGSSDGAVRVWSLALSDLKPDSENEATAANGSKTNGATDAKDTSAATATKQVGRLLGTYNTDNRITCLVAFVMTGTAEEADGALDELDEEEGASSSSDDSE